MGCDLRPLCPRKQTSRKGALYVAPDTEAIPISIRVRRRYLLSHHFQRTINAMLLDEMIGNLTWVVIHSR